jgi:hypothetical protein
MQRTVLVIDNPNRGALDFPSGASGRVAALPRSPSDTSFPPAGLHHLAVASVLATLELEQQNPGFPSDAASAMTRRRRRRVSTDGVGERVS